MDVSVGDVVGIKRTYQIENPPESAMGWDEYECIILAEWAALLNSDQPTTEVVVQTFLEQHPSMVPGAFNIIGNESGHYPWHCGLISQAPLPSYDRRVPDFMWLALNSDTEEPVLVEIETPGKRWFTAAGIQTAHLTQALNQIAEWKAWFGTARNIEAFKAFYGLDRESWRRRRFRPAYVLIYGRRTEANAKPSLTQKRGYLNTDDVTIMTYDRLSPNPKASQLVCMKVDVNGAFSTVSVPPTIKWRPGLANVRAQLSNLDTAIADNRYISPERKRFLIRRLVYWNCWAKESESGVINTSDEE